jgi:Fe-S cluster assembly ATPase SufC
MNEGTDVGSVRLQGSPGQVEWAERIRRQVIDEFDRVAEAFRSVARKQNEAKRACTEAVLVILEEKRTAVLDREDAGYFIQHWQDLGDQVRQLIVTDSGYQAIAATRRVLAEKEKYGNCKT